jgi:hypothetical protein
MAREDVLKEPYGTSEPSYAYPVSRIGWGAVIAGFFIATVTQILLNSLGFAIGLSTVDPQMQASGKTLGIGAGIWTLVTTLISVFIGAWVAGRYTSIREKGEGPLQGVLVWSLSLFFFVWIAAMGVGSALGGLMGVVGQGVAGGAQGAASQMGKQGTSQPSTGQDMGGASEGTTQQGSGQQSGVMNQISPSTDPQQMKEQAKQAAATTAKVGAAAAWWFFITAFLSLGVAIWGGQVGFKNRMSSFRGQDYGNPVRT